MADKPLLGLRLLLEAWQRSSSSEQAAIEPIVRSVIMQGRVAALSPEDLIIAFEHQANDYVKKPFTKQEFQARVVSLIRIQALNKEQNRLKENYHRLLSQLTSGFLSIYKESFHLSNDIVSDCQSCV